MFRMAAIHCYSKDWSGVSHIATCGCETTIHRKHPTWSYWQDGWRMQPGMITITGHIAQEKSDFALVSNTTSAPQWQVDEGGMACTMQRAPHSRNREPLKLTTNTQCTMLWSQWNAYVASHGLSLCCVEPRRPPHTITWSALFYWNENPLPWRWAVHLQVHVRIAHFFEDLFFSNLFSWLPIKWHNEAIRQLPPSSVWNTTVNDHRVFVSEHDKLNP